MTAIDLTRAHASDPRSAAAGSGERFDLLQVLRGFAASWVVLFHIWKLSLIYYLFQRLPAAVREAVFVDGRGGVAVFFVLSGFVIAHSLWGKTVDGRFALTFAVRRSIRLDPAYWASMVLAVAVAALLDRIHHFTYVPPSLPTVLAHLVYLQELLQLPPIQLVYWTLTYEIQFYLVTVAGAWLWLWLTARGRRGAAGRIGAVALPLLFAATALGSAACDQTCLPPGVFLNYWFAFAAGALAYAAGWRRVHWGADLTLAGVVLLSLWRAPATPEVFNTPAALTGAGLYVAARMRWLGWGAGQRWLMGLGAISYSLYLVHMPLIQLGGGAARHFGASPWGNVLTLVATFGMCVAGAALFWFVVEAPSHRLSRRFSPRIRRPRPAPAGRDDRPGS